MVAWHVIFIAEPLALCWHVQHVPAEGFEHACSSWHQWMGTGRCTPARALSVTRLTQLSGTGWAHLAAPKYLDLHPSMQELAPYCQLHIITPD